MTNEQVLKKMIAAKYLIQNQDIEKLSFLQFANEDNRQNIRCLNTKLMKLNTDQSLLMTNQN